jgi:hypothetical protein
VPCLGRAHTLGMSTASFEVQPDGRVEAELVFASAESFGGNSLDRDDLPAFVTEGVQVAADGKACDPTFRGASMTESDGLTLKASYACPRGVGEIVVTLYYLSALGPRHRQIARIVAGNATSEAVLSGDRRAISLRLPVDALRAARQRRGKLLAVVAAAFAAFFLGLLMWRRARFAKGKRA